jgi:DNA-binding XRE family transcriptional regulator
LPVGNPPESSRIEAQFRRSKTVAVIIDTVDSNEPDWVFANTIRAMRRRLGATDSRLSRVSGITRQRIEAIEIGGATTHAERSDITAALARLSKHRLAKALARRRFAS